MALVLGMCYGSIHPSTLSASPCTRHDRGRVGMWRKSFVLIGHRLILFAFPFDKLRVRKTHLAWPGKGVYIEGSCPEMSGSSPVTLSDRRSKAKSVVSKGGSCTWQKRSFGLSKDFLFWYNDYIDVLCNFIIIWFHTYVWFFIQQVFIHLFCP
jgi:hypothetical protein